MGDQKLQPYARLGDAMFIDLWRGCCPLRLVLRVVVEPAVVRSALRRLKG